MTGDSKPETIDSGSDRQRRAYLTNGELREEIVYVVGGDPSRYGVGSGRGLNKEDMLRIAGQLQPDDHTAVLAQCDLKQLYEYVCAWSGGEHQPNAGNVWGINRKNLKKIHAALGGTDPRENK